MFSSSLHGFVMAVAFILLFIIYLFIYFIYLAFNIFYYAQGQSDKPNQNRNRSVLLPQSVVIIAMFWA